MNKKLFESSEFYNRRYNNFSTMIIIPVFLLVLALLVFSVFGKKELTIRTTGEVAPAKVIASIQSTSSNAIIENHLKENDVVKKNDTLLVYNSDQDKTQLNYLTSQLQKAQDQKKQIELLKTGLTNNEDSFDEPDEYGYCQMLEDYLSQVDSLSEDTAAESDTIDNQNASIASVKQEIEDEIGQTNSKLAEYRDLKTAITSNTSLAEGNSLSAMYATYQDQIKANPEQESTLKNQFLSDIETSISQLQSSIDSYTVQEAGAGAVTSKSTSLDNKIKTLQAEQLLNANKEMTTVNANIMELETKITLQKQLNSQSVVLASADGILHINDEVKGLSKISEGSVVAQIYPRLKEKESIHLITYIPTTDISGVKKKMTLRMSIYQNVPKPVILTGKIISVDSSPTRTKTGNFYKVTAETKLSPKYLDKIRYGIQGKAVVITGKKTFFKYYKDKILNAE